MEFSTVVQNILWCFTIRFLSKDNAGTKMRDVNDLIAKQGRQWSSIYAQRYNKMT